MFCVRAWRRTSAPPSSSPAYRSELLPQLVRAPRLASNFHLHNDADNRKFDCFGWKVTLCNFWGYYTKYYTFIKNTYKSLIYMGFLRAWLSVNQWFSAQNLGRCLGQFFSVTTRFIAQSMTSFRCKN